MVQSLLEFFFYSLDYYKFFKNKKNLQQRNNLHYNLYNYIFFLTSPFVLLDFENLLKSIKILNISWKSNYQTELEYIIFNNLKKLFSINVLGYSFLIMMALGIINFNNKKKYMLIPIIPSILYLLFICQFPLTYENPRQILPIITHLTLIIGNGILLIQRIFRKIKILKKYFYLIIILFFIPQINKTTEIIKHKQLPFTSYLSLNWIKKNIPKGSIVISDRYSPRVYELSEYGGSWMPELNKYLSYNIISSDTDYVIINSIYSDLYRNRENKDEKIIKYENTYKRLSNEFDLIFELSEKKNFSTGGTIRIFHNRNKIEFK